MKLLVAEDDPTSRLLLRHALEKWGYEVRETEDGDDAWRVLERSTGPVLAILDWMMPGLSGAELCRRVRRRARLRGSYLLLLTARALREDLVRGLEAGADDYLTKPFDHDELRARVRVGERILRLHGELADRAERLQSVLNRVRHLEGLLPICSHCKRIRAEGGHWEAVEEYVSARSRAEFTHAVCPGCLAEHWA